MQSSAGLASPARRPLAAIAGSPAAMLTRGDGAADDARRYFAASPWPAVPARGDDPPETPGPPGTPAIGGGGRRFGFCVEAGSAGFACWLYAVAGPVVVAGGSDSVQVGSAPERP